MSAATLVLELSETSSLVRLEVGQGTGQSFALPFGVNSLAASLLRHTPLRPIELEHAIEAIEDAVMPLAASIKGCTTLILEGEGARCINAGLAVAGEAAQTLSLATLEALFNRLVAVSEGRPAQQERLPSDARFFAAMTVLRECLHHWHLAEVRLPAALQ